MNCGGFRNLILVKTIFKKNIFKEKYYKFLQNTQCVKKKHIFLQIIVTLYTFSYFKNIVWFFFIANTIKN